MSHLIASRSAKVSQKLFDDKKDDYVDQQQQQQHVYQQPKVMIKSGEYLVENHHPYYSSNQSNSQTTLQPPPPPPSAPTTHMVVPARGVKRPRTICPKPKQEIELMPSDQYYCDDQTMTIVKESEGLFEDQDGEFFL